MGNSSSTPSSSTTTTTNGEQYDVFLSFRGEDTRDGFTSHLYKALDEKQIKTFIDNQLVRGEEISEGLLSVIRESKISVVIFSENYASSKWCLRELAEIMKYREMKNQIVIPVFYKVDPSHIRKQIGSYEAAFAKHANELQQEDEVKKWREALTEASNISGWDSSETRPESEFVRNLVRDIWNKLYDISPSYDFKIFVGIDKRTKRVVSLLCLGVLDFRIIGIWGMGGMGKSTIADAVFHLVSHQFQNRIHFAKFDGNESEKDVIRLRDKIISKVLNEDNLEIGSHSITEPIKRRLNQTKVLIVLDDVDKLKNLEILAGGLDRFGPGSRIILTSRDRQVLRNCGVEDHNMYKVEGLNDDEALQLFCKHAIHQNHPTEDLKDLSREVVKIAKDVPLFVRVLGSSLFKKSNREWTNAVEKFQGNVKHQGFVALKFSYDGLDEEEKGLFLDIACFPLFRWADDLRPILLSDREFSLSALIDKSLVTMDNGWIRMHDLLQEMGREIASKNHSRLWRQEDIFRMLKHNDGIANAVQGIYVDYREVLPLRDTHLISQAIEKMYNLRTLIINCPYSIGDLYYLPDGLRYLHWHKYPMEVLPLSFNPMNLVELDLSYSKIKQLWEAKTPVQKLKLLNLSFCENLIRIPDLSLPSAESIHLRFCSNLIEIHSSRGCPKLKLLNLSSCWKLISIPDLSDIPSAESIDLKFCSSLIEIHSTRGCPKLKLLNLFSCKKLIRIPDLSDIPSAKSIDLESCSSLIEIYSSRGCPKLKLLNLSSCKKLIRIPDLSNIPSAESINLEFCSSLIEIHSSRGCPKLKLLNLSFCKNLIRIPDLSDIPSAEHIVLTCCSSLIEIHSSRGCPKLKQLDLSYCQNLIRIPDLSDIPSAEGIDLESCSSLIEIRSSRGCPKLKLLNLSSCKNLIRIPDLSDIPSAESIDLEFCSSLIEIHSSRGCPKLRQLNLFYCKNLIRIPDLSDIPSAEHIVLTFCSSLIEIYSSRGCPKLKQLDLSYCQNLIRIPDLSDIPSAESIDLESCSSLIEIHSSRGCPKLKLLNLSSCQNLIRIPDLSDIPSAESIDLEFCSSLIEIHSSRGCPKLKQLNLFCCKNLIRIPDLSNIPSAEHIVLTFCSSLIEIHSSRGCPKLKQLDLSYCQNLIRIPDLSYIPSAESIDLESCSSLIEIHSSRECPNNLHSLNLLECKDLSRLPSNIHIEGSEFNLVKCINLTKFPHILGNIKRLKLCYSGVEKVPSTIQSLSKLESLDMYGCESLKHISKSICKLKSLDRLNLWGCCKLESFPNIMEEMELKYLNLSGTAIKELPPSIGNLNRLEQLDLSETAIKDLPPSIGNLNRPEELNFRGCKNLERLPKSIKKLSKLYSLELNDCGMLRSLPELPSSLRLLEAINCKQLIQSLPDESEFEQAINCKQLIQSLPDSSLYFNFINCLEMSQEAVSNLLIFFRDSLRKMQMKKIISLFERDEEEDEEDEEDADEEDGDEEETDEEDGDEEEADEEDERVEGSICLPGSEIPEWFSYKNNGSSINIPGLRNDCGRSSYIMGFTVCLVFGFDFDIGISERIVVRYDFDIETRDGHKEGFFHEFPMFYMPIEDDEFSYSDHIFLGYNLSFECYKLFQKLDTLLANRGMSDYVGTSFEFNVISAYEEATKGCKVKYCGMQPIYVPAQVMNSVSINQDTGDTSGCNDTAEETCEPHPKTICTEAKQCSLSRIMSFIQDTVGL